MIGKSDWQTAYRELIAQGRERVGPPPTVEEVEALFRGDLPPAEAERVRELLTYYPDMARVMTEAFPADAPGTIADEDLAADLERIRQRVQPAPPLPVPFPKRSFTPAFAIAAGVIIAVAIAGIALLLRNPSAPRRMETKLLYADGDRGGTPGVPTQAPIELSTETDYLLKPLYRPARPHREYRVELLDLRSTPPRSLLTRDGLQRQTDGSYPVELSTEKLAPGRYELALYGVNGDVERLATYTLRIYER